MSVELDNARATGVVDLQRTRQSRSGRPSDTLVLRDDPDHNRLRKLLQRPFGPRPVEALRAMVADRVDRGDGRPRARGAMDVIGDFAYPLPVAVFNDMLGLPDEDAPRVRSWIQAVARMLDPVLDEDEYARCQALMDEMYEYLDRQIEVKRRAPADDVLTALVQAEEDGDRLSRDELVAQVVTLYVAGHEPTMSLVGNGLLALLRQPDQLALLRSRPELLPNAVNELLRYDGPNQFVRRIALVPMTVGGRTIGAGDVLYPCVGAANRDPARWDDAGPGAGRPQRRGPPRAVRVGRAPLPGGAPGAAAGRGGARCAACSASTTWRWPASRCGASAWSSGVCRRCRSPTGGPDPPGRSRARRRRRRAAPARRWCAGAGGGAAPPSRG